MAHAARALGLGVMLGCMVESGLGIAAGAQIASLCDHVDLDGNLLLAARPVARRRIRGRRPAALRPTRGSVSRARRLLILAEGHSDDPHYGKTARGVMRYRPEQVVAILDSRAGGGDAGRLPDRRHASTRRSRFGPTTALVGVATHGRPLPAGVARAAEALHRAPASTSRTACTSSSPTTRSSPGSRARHGVELRDLRKPPAGLNVPTGENLDARRAASCSRSAPTARSGR